MASWYEGPTQRGLAFGEIVRFIIDLAVLVIGVLVFAFLILGWNWILNG